MLQDLLEKILKSEIKSKVNLGALVEFLSLFKLGQYIYPSSLKSKFKLSDEETYEILTSLENMGYLKMKYEVFCGFCSKLLGIYDYYSQIEEYVYCEDCEQNSISVYNSKIMYKVVKEWTKV